jgi:glucose/arabinose dehydrogenase
MDFLGPNDILVLEKNDGLIKRIVNGSAMPILKLNVSSKGERGLLGIAVAHRAEKNPYVFLYYTESPADSLIKREDSVGSRLYRYEWSDDRLTKPKIMLSIPPGPKWLWAHNGGAMTIGPDNNLYVAIGDQVSSDTVMQNVRNGSNATGNGGILRMTLDGEPIGSGILGDEYPLNLYYAYGIRNSFGLDFDPLSSNLWDSENGVATRDEINLVQPGFNSGWKKFQGMINQKNGDPTDDNSMTNALENFDGKGKFSNPELTWNFTAGLTGISFLNSSIYGSEYQSDLFVGDFNNGYLYHFDLSKDRKHIDDSNLLTQRVLSYENQHGVDLLGSGFGGIVDVKEGPDGYLYILSTHKGGGDCLVVAGDCVPYLSAIGGSIFKIVPKTNANGEPKFNSDN